MHKKIVIAIVFLFAVMHGFSQKDSVNRVDKKGFKQGLWKQKDKSGSIRYVGFFKDNYPVGEFTHYYPTGKTKVVMIYSNKGQKALAKMYYENGVTLQAAGIYKAKIKDSLWKYYDSRGVLIREESYKNNKLNGIVRTFYPQGGVFEEISYKDSIKDGIWKQFHTNGSPKLDAKFVNGLIEGDFRLYFPTGNLRTYGVYKASLKEGKWLLYGDDNKLKKTEIYIHGKLQETAAEKEKRIKELDSLLKVRLPESVIDPSLEQKSPQDSTNSVKPEDFY